MMSGAESSAYILPCVIDVPEHFVPKVQYALKALLFPLGIEPMWTKSAALDHAGLYYGTCKDRLAGSHLSFCVSSSTLSFFEDCRPYDISSISQVKWQGQGWPVLFMLNGGEKADLIASAFFWLSGWQEHSVSERDFYGRFLYSVSLQARLGIGPAPLVDVYREILAEALIRQGIPVRRRAWGGRKWALCPTHDVDYLRKWRLGMIYREVVDHLLRNGRKQNIRGRVRRFGAFVDDCLRPGDAYRCALERMHRETVRRNGQATYFIKAGAHGPHDVSYSLSNAFLRDFLARLEADAFEIGLHPSFHGHTHPAYLTSERDALSRGINQEIISTRQHYLRYDLNITPRLHEIAGFRIDSTLGFAEQEGFRNGTCMPFRVFDIPGNRPTNIWEMPLAVMESTLFNRRRLNGAHAFEATLAIMEACRRFGGVCVMLWHNTLWDELDFPGWGQHFLDTLDAAGRMGARITSLRQALSYHCAEQDERLEGNLNPIN